MNYRQLFFDLLEGTEVKEMPFFPDISDWYAGNKNTPGEPLTLGCGIFMADDHPMHQVQGRVPEKFHDWTLLDFYRNFDWGYPVHIYDWYEEELIGEVECERKTEGRDLRVTYHTPKGDLFREYRLAANDTWCPTTHLVKEARDLELIKLITQATRFTPRFDGVEEFLRQVGDRGVCDLVVYRSPFGKLVHEIMGFEQTIFALYDDSAYIEEFLAIQEAKDLELIRLAATAPARIILISDHADENLIPPPMYERYCVPYYQQATALLHKAGKFVSTHLDGNFKSLFPLLDHTGFDLLDGCTPAPMFNFEVEELAAALPEGMKTYCGIPATLFCQDRPTDELLTFADRIVAALRGRGILNVGDILPVDGDIEQVIAVGRHLA